MSAALTMALKDLRLVFRDRASLFWILAFPVLFALFLASILEAWSTRADVALQVAVADLDATPAAADYVGRLAHSPSLRVRQLPLAEGRAALRDGEVDALVLVLPGFGLRADWYAGGKEVLRIESDPSRRREASTLQGLLLELGVESAIETELMTDPRATVGVLPMPGLGRSPTPAELVAPAAVLWGLLGCAAAFAISIAAEKQRGTLRRLRSLPISSADLLAGKGIACWSACMGVAGLILLGAILVFQVRLVEPLGLLAVVSALALCFTGIMAVLSTLGSSERSVAGAGWATLLVLGMLGGVMAPRMIMPAWLQTAGAFSPVRWGLVALEHALWRGGAAEAWLLPSVLLAATGLVGLALGTLLLARSTA